MFSLRYNNKAFSLIEVIVALGVFAILAAGVFSVVTSSYKNFYGTGDKQSITEFAQEGIEAARSIRDNYWQDIENVSGSGNQGLTKASGGYWQFNGTSDSLGALTRTVVISDVERDTNDEIVASGGTVDPNTKKVTVTVSGSGIDDYVLTSYLTNWDYKTWEQSDWSGIGDREFWSDFSMSSSSYSNINTSTVSQLGLSSLSGTNMSWSAWADLAPDSAAKYKAWEDFYNYRLSVDGKSLYVIGTTNYDFLKYDLSKAAAGIFSPEFKIVVPWHTQAMALNPTYTNYAYIAKRLPSDGTGNICVVKLDATSVDTANDCYDVTYAGASNYYNDMVVNAAGTKLYVFDWYGYAYVFTISNNGATLTLTNDAQLISSSAGSGYATNSVYLDESGAEPYIYIVSDDYLGEFKKMGFDGDWLSSTSTYAYVDYSFIYDINDIEFLETSSGKNRFIIGTEDSAKEFQIVEDQGSSLTEIGSYDIPTNQNNAEVAYDGGDMAFLHYYSPGGLYAIDISNRASPTASYTNTSMTRRSNYTTYNQMVFSTTSNGLFVHDHDNTANTTTLYFIGQDFTRATGGTYDYKRTITLGENGNLSGGPHTDFPVAISETQSYLKTVSNGGKVYSEDGYDIIFASDSSGTNVLDHEIEYYDGTTGEFVAWVKVPSLAANTDIYMFYGNPDISSTQENVSGVWSANYQLVSHMVDSGIGGVRPSVSSSNGWFKYASSSPTESDGVIGKAQYFDGDYDSLEMENNPDKAQGTSDFTVEFWMKPDSTDTNDYGGPIYFGNGNVTTADGWLFRHYISSKKLYWHMGDGTNSLGGMYLSGSAITDDVWTHVAMTVDRDVGYQSYLDNVAAASYSIDSSASSVGYIYDVTIGRDWSTTAHFYKGDVDELRISLDLKSTDWMTTEYNNMISTSTFYTIGSESAASGYQSPGQLYSSILDLGSTDKELRSITVEQNIPSGCSLQLTAETSDDATFTAANVSSEVYDDASASYYTSSTSATLNGKRYLRYKVDMTSCNGNADTPILYGAKFTYR